MNTLVIHLKRDILEKEFIIKAKWETMENLQASQYYK